MRPLLPLAMVLAVALALPAAAEEGAVLRLGGDVYLGAERAELTEPAADAFLAGETARIAAPLTGSAHLLGRSVAVAAGVGGNLYAAGYDVSVGGAVAGGATLAGYAVEILAPVTGNLRATGRRVRLAAPVGGAAMLAGDEVTLDAAVGGDAVLSGRSFRFGEGARVGGLLTLVAEDPDAIEVPAGVAAAGRITRIRAEDRAGPVMPMPIPQPDWWRVALGAVGWMLAVAVATGILALIAPQGMAALRQRVAGAPFGSIGLGFLTLSALVGAGLVVALTLVGLLLMPAAVALAAVAGLAGYLVGLYALGAWALKALGRGEPELAGERLLAALAGALIAALIALVPVAGWLFGLALMLAGLGALTARWLRPAFFVPAGAPGAR